jgi:hypothetical protein
MKSLNEVAAIYLPVIKKWKNRWDVQYGEASAYRKGQSLKGPYSIQNKPHSIGEGLTLCGFCVSTSQNFLYNDIFQLLLNDRGAHAKLISIDIKEKWYAKTYTGSQNKWHTAILVKDTKDGDHLFIIDLTASQFSSDFLEKFIFDFSTWGSIFRSENCKHVLTDFDHNILSHVPVANLEAHTEYNETKLINELHNVTTITDGERSFLAEFFLNKVHTLNRKLLLGNVNNFDFSYLSRVNKLLKSFSFVFI